MVRASLLQRRRLTVAQLPPPSQPLSSQYPLGCVPVCLHACMSTHTCFPIIPSPRPPHLLRLSRAPLSDTLLSPLSFRISLLSLLFFFLLSYLPHPPIFTSPFHLSFSLSLSLFLLSSFFSRLLPSFLLLFFCHLVSPFIRYFFQTVFTTRNGGARPQQQWSPNQFFLSLLFPTLSLFPPTPVFSLFLFSPPLSLSLPHSPSREECFSNLSLCRSFARQSIGSNLLHKHLKNWLRAIFPPVTSKYRSRT